MRRLKLQRLKLFGLATIAIFVLGVSATAVASAEELRFLPEGTEANPVTFTAKSGAGRLQSSVAGLEISCLKDKSTGEVTSKRLGRFHVDFEGCEEVGINAKCASLERADATGIILVLGTFHLRRTLASGPVLTFLIFHVHILCALVLLLLLGCVAGTYKPTNTLTKVLTAELKQAGGKNDVVAVDNDAETGMENCELKLKTGAEVTEVQAGEETNEEIENFKRGGVAVEALLMS